MAPELDPPERVGRLDPREHLGAGAGLDPREHGIRVLAPNEVREKRLLTKRMQRIVHPRVRGRRRHVDGLVDNAGRTKVVDRDRANAATLDGARGGGRGEPTLDHEHEDARTDEEADAHGHDVGRGVHGEQVPDARGDEEQARALARRERQREERGEAGEAEDERRSALHADRRDDGEHDDSAERQAEEDLRAEAERGAERAERGKERRGAGNGDLRILHDSILSFVRYDRTRLKGGNTEVPKCSIS